MLKFQRNRTKPELTRNLFLHYITFHYWYLPSFCILSDIELKKKKKENLSILKPRFLKKMMRLDWKGIDFISADMW